MHERSSTHFARQSPLRTPAPRPGRSRTVASTPNALLLPPVAHARASLANQLRNADDLLESAEASVDLAGAMLGARGRRRYFMAFATLAEMRGTGGFLGLFGVVTADRG